MIDRFEIQTDYGQRVRLEKVDGGDVALEAISHEGDSTLVTLRPSQADRLAAALYDVNGTPRPV